MICGPVFGDFDAMFPLALSLDEAFFALLAFPVPLVLLLGRIKGTEVEGMSKVLGIPPKVDILNWNGSWDILYWFRCIWDGKLMLTGDACYGCTSWCGCWIIATLALLFKAAVVLTFPLCSLGSMKTSLILVIFCLSSSFSRFKSSFFVVSNSRRFS